LSGTHVALGQRAIVGLAKAFTDFCFLGMGLDIEFVILIVQTFSVIVRDFSRLIPVSSTVDVVVFWLSGQRFVVTTRDKDFVEQRL
jgi:hypothetical protein